MTQSLQLATAGAPGFHNHCISKVLVPLCRQTARKLENNAGDPWSWHSSAIGNKLCLYRIGCKKIIFNENIRPCSSMFFNVLHVVSCGLHLPGEHPVSQRSSAQRAKAQPSVDQTNYVSIHTAIASRYVSMNHITSFQEIHLSVPNTTSKTSNEVLPVSSTGSGHKKRNIVDMSRHRKA